MGWTFGNFWRTKQDVVEHCIDWGTRFATLNHSVRGNRLWVLLQYNEGERKGDVFVALYLLSNSGGEWGYKDLDDTVGPYYYDCPLSYLTKTIESGRALSESTKSWHENVRKYHAEQRSKKKEVTKMASKLKPGVVLEFCDKQYKLCEKYPGRKGWEVRCLDDNKIYRMMHKQVYQATLVA